jgi:hypothetical protein
VCLFIYSLIEGRAVAYFYDRLPANDPDLAFAEPFGTAGGYATLETALALLLVALLAFRPRRLQFAAAAALLIGVLVSIPTAFRGSEVALSNWQLDPGSITPTDLDVGLVLLVAAGLVAAVVGWRSTPARRSWLDLPFSGMWRGRWLWPTRPHW